ncbi:protein of unknown function [Xenorhabdus poinarii G6]|uniref:Uncharacterized protein n=1 Tax=Xenorhabdus poinarii G6 TaxID=1354304 RepID=A0A068R5N2_9GAMM|nr:protein of unknown function [Xenorhabdus poinarii G6]
MVGNLMMKPTILIYGSGPGISHAVASRFGKVGHRVKSSDIRGTRRSCNRHF